MVKGSKLDNLKATDLMNVFIHKHRNLLEEFFSHNNLIHIVIIVPRGLSRRDNINQFTDSHRKL